MTIQKTLVIDAIALERKITRMAWELYERHFSESHLVMVGISNSGYTLAGRIAEKIQQISPLSVQLLELSVNKRAPQKGPTTLHASLEVLDNQAVVVIDDVLNAGTTLIYAVQYLLNAPVRRMTTAVLVDRNHKSFPIKADVKGLSLSTSLHDQVDVSWEENAVYLR